jgi:hypothetical protein
MPPLVFPLSIPAHFGWPLKSTLSFSTIVQEPPTKRGSVRISTTEFPNWEFSLDLSFLRGDATQPTSDWAILMNFYGAVQGAFADWFFLHPYDNTCGSLAVTGSVTSGIFAPDEQLVQATSGATANLIGRVLGTGPMLIGPVTGAADSSHGWVGQTSGAVFTPTAVPTVNTTQAIATGDGTTLAFSMIRTLVTGGAQQLIQDFVNPPAVYVNGVLKATPADYVIDQYGTITFTVAPGAGQTIAWIGQFYFRCHFTEDRWQDLSEDFFQIWRMDGMKFETSLL